MAASFQRCRVLYVFASAAHMRASYGLRQSVERGSEKPDDGGEQPDDRGEQPDDGGEQPNNGGPIH